MDNHFDLMGEMMICKLQKNSATRWLTTLVMTLLMTGCASQDVGHATKAATAPLQDLNLIKDDIPPVLLAAQAKPYALPDDTGCENLQAQILALDDALGPDLDTPATETNPGLIERGIDEAKASLIKVIGRTTEGALPFRSWVRKLSGAERHARQALAAITAGTIRRGFLKGVLTSRNCA